MRNTYITRIILNDYHWSETSRRLKFIPVFDGSHRKEDANAVGTLGEVIFEAWLMTHGVPFTNHTDRTDLDYVVNNLTIDVKTKDRTVPPTRDYDCSIPLYNHNHQKPDLYVFISLERDRADEDKSIKRFKTAYIVGGISQDELEELGTIWNAGDIDPSNNTKFWTSCLNIKMGDLISPKNIIEIFKKVKHSKT